ncbi:MAG: hypothetical protein HC763_25265 [Hydrococcus sp. CRU_1_1]|nr:hypothetical protein [Hydrococcus sp. CRU_1_1]
MSRDLGRLAASQYLAELVLCMALSDRPERELYELLGEHLRRLEQSSDDRNILAYLSQAVFTYWRSRELPPKSNAAV